MNYKENKARILFILWSVISMAAVSACSAGIGNGGIPGHENASGISRTQVELSTVEKVPTAEPTATNSGNGSTSESGSSQSTGKLQQTGTGMVGGNTSGGDDSADYSAARTLLDKMSIEEKIGQLFLVGFTGETASEEIKNMVRKYHVGGIILFRNNITSPTQLLALTNSLKGLNLKNRAPIFLSVDEEGGRITRMPEQLHKIPSNEVIGKINDSELSFNIGNVIAYELRAFGFNLDFAPVLDIFSNPENTVIGDRAFGTEPDIVSKLGTQTMKGIREGGVIPVVKHFPGHGDTLVDSHKGLPTVEYDMKRLKSFELKPFQAAIASEADAVMIAHILMKSIDPENPASLSKAMITDVLRNQMGFTGVVVSDDMTMGAIIGNYQIGDAVVKSVNAGSDIILVCHGYDNQVNAINALTIAVKNGIIAEERLNDSVFRILKLKEKYGLKDEKIISVDPGIINKKIDDVLDE